MARTSCFIDVGWLTHFGLRRDTVMAYFYTSPFFDAAANNSIAQAQGVSLEHLKDMRGLEYALDDAVQEEPALFVVRKQMRRSPTSADLLDVFYVLDGTVYACPDFLELCRSRFAKACVYSSAAFAGALSGVRYSGDASLSLQLTAETRAPARLGSVLIELPDFNSVHASLNDWAGRLAPTSEETAGDAGESSGGPAAIAER